ncbi:MAG: DUF1552 domain-containing protein [Moraxellaceae bacterium]|nr:MAG: DUF1552 domain-containing protein [Moraxellaceae bacterium]
MLNEQTRRNFIKKAALVGAAASAYKPLQNFAAPQIQDIRRVVFVFIPGGALPNYWQAQGCDHNFVFAPMSQPLEPIKQNLVFLNNLTMARGGHGSTFNALGGWFAPKRATLDTELTTHLSAGTPFKQITFSAGNSVNYSVSMSQEGTQIPPLSDPFKAYANLFGTLESNQKGILDENFVGNYRDIQYNFDQLSQLHIELTTLALQRNKTNIVSLMLGSDEADFTIPDVDQLRSYHNIMAGGTSADYVRARAYLTKKFTYLVQLLAATKDSRNISLLNSTLVVMVTDMGNGSDHTLTQAPFLLAGGTSFMRGDRLIDATGYDHLDLLDTVSSLLGAPVANYGKGPIKGVLK